MNDLIAKLYDQSLIIESNGDYVSGELDPVKFAELIALECQLRVEQYINDCGEIASIPDTVIMKHFGIE
jgi:hypothetical protein